MLAASREILRDYGNMSAATVLFIACDVWRKLFTAEELVKARKRIAIVSRLDLIGRAVATLVRMVRPAARAAHDGAAGLPLARGWPLVGGTFAMARDPKTCFAYRSTGASGRSSRSRR